MPLLEKKPVNLVDAIFWTISHMTTVGVSSSNLSYSHPILELFTALVQISGIGLFFLTIPLVILPYLEKQLQVKLPTKVPARLSNHILICGYSPLVESLVEELEACQCSVIIVDKHREIIQKLIENDRVVVFGDPASELVLKLSRAQASKALIANLEDEENADIILAASSIGAKNIIALVDDLSMSDYFKYAGANQVVSPKQLLGRYLAKKSTTSLKDELLEDNEIISGLEIVELPIYPDSPLENKNLKQANIRDKTGANVVAVWHRGKLQLELGQATRLSPENVIVAVGSREELLELQKLTTGKQGPGLGLHKSKFIIVGFGDVGKIVIQELKKQKIPHTVIDSRPLSGNYLHGDATKKETLIKAGIKRASTLIVASHIDQHNIFTTLIARKLNPRLHVIARANSTESVDKLYRAGADFVFSLSAIAGQILAHMIQGEKMITLAEGLKVLTVLVNQQLANYTIGKLKIRTVTGCTIIATGKNQKLQANPGPTTKLKKGDLAIVLGSRQQVEIFKERFKVKTIEEG